MIIKEGYPEENEVVICTVTNIQYHSVFVKVDEYKGKSGMIHISEISPGRIRNLRDYVKEGKVIVCKVLRINRQRGHIDLSLRRVNENQRRAKINAMKQEQIAEKIISYVAQNHNLPDLQKKISTKLSDYESLYTFFEEVVEGSSSVDELGLDPKVAKDLEEVIHQRIKPPEVFIEGNFTIQSYEPNGLEVIKKAFVKVPEENGVKYLGGGKYYLEVRDSNYKDAEKQLTTLVDGVKKVLEKTDTKVEFERKR
ncbi:MAG: S1 RNA-binding domain-containing protein [Candidatus Woesearchaeota archaeon]